MECSICYETFFIPKKNEEFEEFNHTFQQAKTMKELDRLTNLLITSQHNTTYRCSTSNCEAVIYRDCWTKIKFKGIDLDNFNYDNVSSMLNTFVCPYCRKPDWKDYMNDVYLQLGFKLLQIKRGHR